MLICALTLVLNMSGTAWTKQDTDLYKEALTGCPKRYKDSPCLTKFIKVGPHNYKLRCGPKTIKKRSP